MFYFVFIHKPFDDLAAYLCIVRHDLADCVFCLPLVKVVSCSWCFCGV